MSTSRNFNDDFNAGQLEEQRLRIEKLKIDLENERRKSSNLEYEGVKLQQETGTLRSKFINGFLPTLQLLASVFLIFVTYRIGFNKNVNESVYRDAQSKKNIVDSETVMIRNQGLLNRIENMTENYKLLQEADSLKNKKIGITIENSKLSETKDSLLHVRDNLAARIQRLEIEKSQVGNALDDSKDDLQSLLFQKKKTEEELQFIIFKYALELARENPSAYYWYSDTLISEISKKTVFSNRIIDTLFNISKIKRRGYYGYSYYILFKGTGDGDFKNLLFQSIENLITGEDSSFSNCLNAWDIFNSDKWKKDERIAFTRIVINNIDKVNKNPNFKSYLFNLISELQNHFNDLNLWSESPDLYIKYLLQAKILAIKYDTLVDVHEQMARSFAIMCPQYYLSKKYILSNRMFGFLAKSIDTAEIINLTNNEYILSNINSSLSNSSMERLKKLHNTISFDNLKGKRKIKLSKSFSDFVGRYKSMFDFWNDNDFQNSSNNRKIICEKLIANEF